MITWNDLSPSFHRQEPLPNIVPDLFRVAFEAVLSVTFICSVVTVPEHYFAA